MCNPDHLRLLHLAREFLAGDQAGFICHALWIAGQDLQLDDLAGVFKMKVMYHLHPYDTYSGWATRDQHIVLRTAGMRHQHRAGRLAWLDAMIAAAEAGEDVPPPLQLPEV